jgi:riboflavin transporter FmnP
MVVTVTTTTVTTITSIVALGLVGTVTLLATLNWLSLLVTRVLASATDISPVQRIARSSVIGILPFTVVFIIIFSVKLAEILG